MSTLEATCCTYRQGKGGAGEMNLTKSNAPIADHSDSSNLVVSEVLDEILENAFDVVTTKSLQPPPKLEKITSNVVGDILENILSPAVDGSVPKDETALLDGDIKKIIQEMQFPSVENKHVSTKGIGDQLGVKSETKADKILSEPIKRTTLERKNRLTNLVRSSKQMLTKLVSNDTEHELRMTKSEELHEKVLKVIDLQGDDHFFEAGCSSATGILRMPRDASLQNVELKVNVKSEGPQVEKDISDVNSKKSASSTKKKCSLGCRIMRYFKRNKEGKRE